jgi:hypothetical protein
MADPAECNFLNLQRKAHSYRANRKESSSASKVTDD